MSARFIILLSLTTLLLFSILSPSLSKTENGKVENDDDDEDLSFLEDASDKNDAVPHDHHYPDSDQFEGDDIDNDDFENYSDFDDSESDPYKEPEIDDKDVVVLKERNFSDFIENHKFVMVEFYAPWCGHCQALAPEYAAAATELKGEDVALAKVDATEDSELAQEYDVQGFPTVYFFVDGVHKPYPGQRTKDAIVTWIKKKIGPGIYNITTLDDAERVLTSDSKVVLGYINSLVLFHLDPKVKRPALVLIKNEAEKLNYFDGNFSKSEIVEFVFANKLPLVTTFTRESAPSIFESPIKKQLLLFATSNDSGKVLPIFQEAAKFFKGKLVFVYVELDNEDVGKPVADYFGITGNAPTVLAYTGNNDGQKFVLDGELTLEKIKTFGEEFLEDRLKPFFKSDPVPETNDGDVKIVVGNNFDEIVLDESKDVLLEADGFPTILFFPAGNKSFDPLTVDTDRTVVALYKFIKKHASIPFKLQKPASTPKPESSDTKGSQESSTNDVKDEL
ncbi:hypothetical protein GH714_002581 [Hevea brasiliensis]|uniref:protein disulfide-isomerase n=1 Tax=Hevea brasiliensis TaxID=3981 RepID=A0A6A6NA91_HEVBR|nr:hypothetical protein GH714_002581 [Hevea brasiliensis]